MGKHTGARAFSLRIGLASAYQFVGRHYTARQRAGGGNFRARSFARELLRGFGRHGRSVVDRGQLWATGGRSVAFADGKV